MNLKKPSRSWRVDNPTWDGCAPINSGAEDQPRFCHIAEGFVLAHGRQNEKTTLLAMNKRLSVAIVLLTFGLMVPAHGFYIINNDRDTYTLELFIGEHEPLLETFTLNEGDAVEYECKEGCIIQLENGVMKTLMESDALVIFDGEITVIEESLERNDQSRLGL